MFLLNAEAVVVTSNNHWKTVLTNWYRKDKAFDLVLINIQMSIQLISFCAMYELF